MSDKRIGYFPNGPDVWRVVYGGNFWQFDDIKKALNFIEDKLTKKHNHQLSIQRVNLKEVELCPTTS